MTALENHNLVSTLDGRESVGDHEGRSTRHQLLQRLLHLRFVLRDDGDDDDDDGDDEKLETFIVDTLQ